METWTDGAGVLAGTPVGLRPLDEHEGRLLIEIVLGSDASREQWRRARIVLLAAQAVAPPDIDDAVGGEPGSTQAVIGEFNRKGLRSLGSSAARGGR